jgi:hypothetical protein
VHLEFSSTRPPGEPAADRRWQRSYWPGGLLLAAGAALHLPGTWPTNLTGQIVALLGGCLLASTFVTRRRLAADTTREPRRWTITDEDLKAANTLGSVRWTWIQVKRVVERPEVYLLYQTDSPHTATFDVPRDTLTPTQDTEFRAFLSTRGLLPTG